MEGPDKKGDKVMLESGFRKWIAAADTVVLACWDLGHIWDADLYDHVERRPHGAYSMTGRCKRGCEVERTRFLTSTWSPDSNKNSYRYPRNYSPKDFMEGNPFFMSAEHRAAIRRELGRRAREDAKGADVIHAKFSG